MFPILLGTSPPMRLPDNNKVSSLLNNPKVEAIVPVSKLADTSSIVKPVNNPIEVGSVPDNWNADSDKDVTNPLVQLTPVHWD
mmetsp:Transcript_5956/g.6141  ORF Transcript_5956/g.6141 Transcript_5956/m.6141 type:complete len:83 (+) Transcript_5956:1336-1584(+)